MEQAGARLRRTFHFTETPEHDDGSEGDEALDEEEQERLIEQLAIANRASNEFYMRILLGIDVLCTIPYIPSLRYRATSFLAILSITCLLSTAFLLHVLPLTTSGLPLVDRLLGLGTSSSSSSWPMTQRDPSRQRQPTTDHDLSPNTSTSGFNSTKRPPSRPTHPLSSSPWRLPTSLTLHPDDSPILRFLPLLNAVLALVLGALGAVVRARHRARQRGGGADGAGGGEPDGLWPAFEYLPGAMCVAGALAKALVNNVDPEAELRALRYPLKGA